MNKILIPFVILILAVLACSSGTSTPAAISATNTSGPGSISVAGPTATQAPSATQVPIDTQFPTATIASTAAPLVFTGSGDKVLDISNWTDTGLLYAKYTGGDNFIIQSYDSNGNPIDLLVNTIGAYEGVQLINYDTTQPLTTRLQIKSSGPWNIEIRSTSTADKLVVPGTFKGKGDDVIILNGGTPDLLDADSSQAQDNFIVYAFDPMPELIVNEIAPYTGENMLTSMTGILEIKATGPWTIKVRAK